MGFVTLARDRATGNYLIVDNDDEKLYVVAELLLNSAARKAVKSLIDIDDPDQDKAQSGNFKFIKQHEQHIDIKLYDPQRPRDAANPLEIIIALSLLDDLIDAWEMYMLEPPEKLVISRRRDSDIIQLGPEPILT